MAENCGFRSKFGGFNKEDVLMYINTLQEEHGRELAAQSEAYEKALSEANKALEEQYAALQAEREEQEKLQQLINEQYALNRELRDQVAECEEARASYAALKERAAQLEQRNAHMKEQVSTQYAAQEQELRRKVAELSTQNQQLKEENSRYHDLVNDVGHFVVEVRAMGTRYLEEANERCQSRLAGITGAIESLRGALEAASNELAVANEALDVQNNRAEQRLIALADELERSAANVSKSSVTSAETAASFF